MKRKRGGGPINAGPGRAASAAANAERAATSNGGRDGEPVGLNGAEEVDPSARIAPLRRDSSRSSIVRPNPQSREVSSSSLRRNMRAMVLSDREEIQLAKPDSSRSTRSTRSVTRQANGVVASRNASASSSQGSGIRQQEDIGEDDDDDEDDVQYDRLLQQAPSWQLRKLTKGKLFKLHVRLGTFKPAQWTELDSFNKQDLVEGIIQSRSHDGPPTSSTSYHHDASPSSSTRRRVSYSNAAASIKRSATNSTVASRSSEYTDETEAHSDTDANDAAGEETEVEPVKPLRRNLLTNASPLSTANRNARARAMLRGANGAGVAFPSRKDVSNEGSSTRSGSIISPAARRRLRHKGSLVFAASSPVRTRARTRNQSTSAMQTGRNGPLPFGQRTLHANGSGDMVLDCTVTPKQNRRRRSAAPTVAFRISARETDDGEESSSLSEADLAKQSEADEDWEDDSPTVARRRCVRTPRKAKIRAQQQLHQALEEDSEAMVEHALNGPPNHLVEDSEDMSLDETFFGKRRSSGRSASPALSDMSLDEATQAGRDIGSEEEEEEDSDSDHTGPSEFEANASPSKMRRLRNGKIRLPTTLNPTGSSNEMLRPDGLNGKHKDVDMFETDQEFTASALNRLKRDRLIELCEQGNVLHAKDATRAVLIDALLEHHGRGQEGPSSARTERPDSASSSRTARPESSLSGSSSGKGSRRVPNGSAKHSEKPLLLRSGPLEAQAHSRPNTPVPSPQHEEELNGLDLESLQLVDKEIPFSKLEKLDKIGSGGFKDVYIGKYHISKKTTKKVAIADIRDQLSEMDIKELTLLRDLKHENIVRFIGVCIPPLEMRLTPCMIVSELCTNGDLYDYIRNTEPPADDEIFRIMLETARGLEYLHLRTPAIIHRDCKSTNVLITRNRTAKINDFGLARVRNSKRSMIKSLVGTVNWQAVELWTPKPKYNEKVDVWSAAMTFWETLQWHQPEKKYPFQDMNEHQIYQDVGQKKLRPPTVAIRRQYGSEIVDLLDRMWNHNPKERPTMTQVCEEMERLMIMKREAAGNQATGKKTARNASR